MPLCCHWHGLRRVGWPATRKIQCGPCRPDRPGIRLRKEHGRTMTGSAQAILGVVEGLRGLGYRETQYGVRLFGPAPHVAPKAWCHALPRGLRDSEIESLSRAIGNTLTPA